MADKGERQLVICRHAGDVAKVRKVLDGAEVIDWYAGGWSDSSFVGRDVIVFGASDHPLIHAGKPGRLRICTVEIPETFTIEWAKMNMREYVPPTESEAQGEVPLPDVMEPEVIPLSDGSPPVALDLTESAPAAAVASGLLIADSEQTAPQPVADHPHAAVAEIEDDQTFITLWRVMTPEQRANAGEPAYKRAIAIDLAGMYRETIVGRALLADQDEPSEVSDDPDIGEPPEYVTEQPAGDLPPPNGHDYAEPSRIWTQSLLNAGAWKNPPKPQDIYTVRKAPEEFDPARLFSGPFGFLAAYVQDCSELKGTDCGIAASGVLGALSAWCHESWRLQVKSRDTSWKEACRIWTMNVGESATGKTPALSLALAPAYALNEKCGEDDARRIAKYLSDKRVRDLKIGDYEKRAAKNELKAGEEMPEPVDSIEVDNRMFKGANVEGARDKLQSAPKLWLVTQELATWLASFGRYAANKTADSGDRAFWMDCFDGAKQAPELRAGREIQSSASCVITANITPSSLRVALGGAKMEGDGLAQRFIPVSCRVQKHDENREQNLDALAAFTCTLANLRKMRPANGEPLRLHPDGYIVFQEFQKRLAELADDEFYSPNCRSALVKYQSHAPRIALTLHLAMRAESSQDCGPAEYVSAETMRIACSICESWIPHTLYFWETTLGDSNRELDADAMAVCEAIACYHLRDETVSLREICNSSKSLRGREPRELARAMAMVCDMGWLDDDPLALNSRKGCGLRTFYRVNPRLFPIYDEHPEILRARYRRKANYERARAAMQDKALREGRVPLQ